MNYRLLIPVVLLVFSGSVPGVEPTACPVSIDGSPLEFFDPERTSYVYYLPHQDKSIPKTTLLRGAEPVSSPDARSFRFSWKAPSQKERRIFRIDFEVLPKLDLFLCLGQSNMAGRGELKKELGDEKPIPDVFLLTPGGHWEQASNPLNKYSSVRKRIEMQRMAPPYAFAKKIAESTGRPVGLIVNALGGSSLESWMKESQDPARLYSEAIRRTRNMEKWGDFKAILWHQGESNRSRVEAYPDLLGRLIKDLRADLGKERLLFVAGEIGRWRMDANGKDVSLPFNEMLQGLKKHIPYFDVVSAEGLTPLNGDPADPHFNRESMLILGDRYADSVLKNVYAPDKNNMSE